MTRWTATRSEMAEPAAVSDPGRGPPLAGLGQPPPKRKRDAWVVLGMTVSALSAAVSSFSGLRELAMLAGWSDVLSPLLPLCIDSLAMTSVRVWVSSATRSERARRFARRTALGAVLLSLAGNAVYHVIAAGLLEVTWLVVLSVGAVPALVLGLVSHLAVVRGQEGGAEDGPRRRRAQSETGLAARHRRVGDGPKSASVRRSRNRSSPPRYGSEDDLLTAARDADATFRAQHGGRRISRDELRRVLGISTDRASGLVRELRNASNGSAGLLQDAP